jgi:TolB-like protein/Flp pilus assembly protein TadD/predicted Ser/Thr protein kinase
VFADAPQGVCSVCLFRTGLASLDNEDDESFEPTIARMSKDFGDYELLEEIGRGGQGVVYRARQKSLNRIVALKVIGLAHWATEAHVKRFRLEAEAAARLNHPCIVPIYEVGERDGACYFSMGLVEGGPLDAVAKSATADSSRGEREPIPIRNAVELIVKLARTVSYAHEHGILHRDIKPGNILLDAKGEPHLTDFGLARLVETESTVTRTMEVLGTPSYMAPEQAVGNNARVSSATDIYGLGAVFYQLLTGQPPFAGGTTYETIKLLLDTEPRQPRLLNPKVDRDLATICLKCLEKDPQRRYSSALALAADLEYWLRHEPIRARRTGPFTRGRKWLRRNPATALSVVSLVALAAAIAVIVWKSELLLSRPATKSVAVLPFENLSPDADNAYFASGIQDEILTRLAKIADLKVISRTSTQYYQSKPRNLRQIAKQLGVANILEGSVQKAAGQVRVNVQLINAQTDSHLWADTFDRKLTDIFSVESEIAKAIAEQLRAKLTGEEEQNIAARPTDNTEAYDAYLRGLAYTLKPGNSADDLAAQKYLKQAVRLDPKFALGWALLSYVDADGYRSNSLQPTVALREEARQAADTALTLQPNLGEAVFAKGQYHYSCLRDYDTAVRYFEQARQLLPNNGRILGSLAFLERRRGRWDRSESYFNEAERLDPRNVHLLTHHAVTYKLLRRFPEALRKFDQVLNITPDDVGILAEKASIAQAEGDLPRAAALLAPLHPNAGGDAALATQVYQVILERRPTQIIPRLKEILAKPDPALGFTNGELRFWLGWAQQLAGDHADAQESWRQARSELESFLKEQPENSQLIDDLALTNMGLGDKAAALALAERAMAASPIEKDALQGAAALEILARVAAQMGESDRAIAALEKLLLIPYGCFPAGALTPALLRLDPMFDPLRNDPRFQKLVATGIAVLPFENRSEDKPSAYFADGIQDEILTRLSKIADLKVISRTSTQHYKSAPGNLPEIAKQLGVAHIVEGSVQKSGDTVRVNVQLIKAANDSHIWAETFDRKLTDIFSVESEIAKSIADQLRLQLSGQEEQAIAAKPTDNPEAYDAYLRGLALLKAANPDLLATQKYLREAVRLDPKFALSWALLSWFDAAMYRSTNLPQTIALREEARQAAETALTLQPNLGEAILAKGFYHYACLRDYDTAVPYFEQARQLLPNSSLVPQSMAFLERRRGHWDKSESYFNEAERLDPRNADLLGGHATNYVLLRRFPEALRKFDQVLNITPDNVEIITLKALVPQAEGDLPRAAALLAQLHPNADNGPVVVRQVYQAILERRPAQIIPRLKEILAKPDPELRFWLGWAQEVGGDHAAAQQTWRQARSELEFSLNEQPENDQLMGYLALTNAGLGDKAAAFKLVERAMATSPIEKDAFLGPCAIEILARVAAQMGEPDRAIAALERLLSIAYGGALNCAPLTPALLRLDPMFDPLRNDPRFQRLCEAKQP